MKLKNSVAISDSGFIFNAATGDSFTTNDTGRFLLSLLKEGHDDVSELVERMMDHYEVERELAEKDVLDFLSLLQQWHLLDR